MITPRDSVSGITMRFSNQCNIDVGPTSNPSETPETLLWVSRIRYTIHDMRGALLIDLDNAYSISRGSIWRRFHSMREDIYGMIFYIEGVIAGQVDERTAYACYIALIQKKCQCLELLFSNDMTDTEDEGLTDDEDDD